MPVVDDLHHSHCFPVGQSIDIERRNTRSAIRIWLSNIAPRQPESMHQGSLTLHSSQDICSEIVNDLENLFSFVFLFTL